MDIVPSGCDSEADPGPGSAVIACPPFGFGASYGGQWPSGYKLPTMVALALLNGRAPVAEDWEQDLEDLLLDAFICASHCSGGDTPWDAMTTAVAMLLDLVRDDYPGMVSGRRPTLTARLRREVMERDAYRCRECGDWHDLRVDHVIPFAAGGPTTLENLQVLCVVCNTKKGATL